MPVNKRTLTKLLCLAVTFATGCDVGERSDKERTADLSTTLPDLLPSSDAGPALDTRQKNDLQTDTTVKLHDAATRKDSVGPKEARPCDTAVTREALLPPPSSEIVLFDQKSLQFTASDNGFHSLVAPGAPLPVPNWLVPNDYYNGEFQVRYVVEGPSTQQPGQLQTCIWTMPGYFPESCSAQVPFGGTGVTYNTKLIPASWWKLNSVPLDFAHPEKLLVRVVLRGPSGCNVTTYNVANGCWSEWPKYQAMKFRITIVMVAKGKVFSGWKSYP